MLVARQRIAELDHRLRGQLGDEAVEILGKASGRFFAARHGKETSDPPGLVR
jgi:hypothetical protein